MDLIGKVFKHTSFGIGTVTAQKGNRITIEFSSKTSDFFYSNPISYRFLSAVDPIVQAAIDKELAEIAEEERQKAETEALAKQKKAEARQAALITAQKTSTPAKKTYIKPERIPGIPKTFYVFQGGTFPQESAGGHIWAPIHNRNGDTPFHWEKLTDVRPGDIIFHGYNAHIQAVSIALCESYNALQPEALKLEGDWSDEGRRVDCAYHILKKPIKTSDHRDAIIEHCKTKYSPFDKDGNGNMGYLYDLNPELCQIFMRAICAQNPEINKIEAFANLISDKDL